MIHLIWIIPVVMVTIIILATGWRPSKPNIPHIHWGWIVGAIIAICFILAIFGGIKSCSDNKKAEKIVVEKYATAHPPAAVANTSGQKKTLFVFPPDGCITKHLQGNWSDYPKGGAITFTDISTGKVVLVDKPGTATNSKLPSGNYRICKKDNDAWGVDIWE